MNEQAPQSTTPTPTPNTSAAAPKPEGKWARFQNWLIRVAKFLESLFSKKTGKETSGKGEGPSKGTSLGDRKGESVTGERQVSGAKYRDPTAAEIAASVKAATPAALDRVKTVTISDVIDFQRLFIERGKDSAFNEQGRVVDGGENRVLVANNATMDNLTVENLKERGVFDEGGPRVGLMDLLAGTQTCRDFAGFKVLIKIGDKPVKIDVIDNGKEALKKIIELAKQQQPDTQGQKQLVRDIVVAISKWYGQLAVNCVAMMLGRSIGDEYSIATPSVTTKVTITLKEDRVIFDTEAVLGVLSFIDSAYLPIVSVEKIRHEAMFGKAGFPTLLPEGTGIIFYEMERPTSSATKHPSPEECAAAIGRGEILHKLTLTTETLERARREAEGEQGEEKQEVDEAKQKQKKQEETGEKQENSEMDMVD